LKKGPSPSSDAKNAGKEVRNIYVAPQDLMMPEGGKQWEEALSYIFNGKARSHNMELLRDFAVSEEPLLAVQEMRGGRWQHSRLPPGHSGLQV
jgi:hypothetical protein